MHPFSICSKLPQAPAAGLLSLEVQNFKVFDSYALSLDAGVNCVVGPNASGKSSIAKAIAFVLLRAGGSVDKVVRFAPDDESRQAASVSARFAVGRCRIQLRREFSVDGGQPRSRFWIERDGVGAEVSSAEYAAGIAQLRWQDLTLPQFGLLKSHSAARLLQLLPSALGSAGAKLPGKGADLEERFARRLDEVYRELTREPLDEAMTRWGEGGQLLLQRLGQGFTVFASERRGLGGVALEKLADGDRDVCGLSLLLTLPMLGRSPSLLVLDEPDARLDRRRATALRRFLSTPGAPQCLLLSLNNHRAFDDALRLRDS